MSRPGLWHRILIVAVLGHLLIACDADPSEPSNTSIATGPAVGVATPAGGFGFIFPNGVHAELQPVSVAAEGVNGVSLGVAPKGVNRDCVVKLHLSPLDQMEEDEVDLTSEPSVTYPTPRAADAWLLRPAPGPAESILVIPVGGWVGTVAFSEGDPCPPEKIARALATLHIGIDPDRNMPVVEAGELATVAAQVPPQVAIATTTGFVLITLGSCSDDLSPNEVCLAQGGASAIEYDPQPNVPALAIRGIELILGE